MPGPSIVFSSWHGQYSDNPRALSEALGRRGGQLRRVWIAGDPAALPADVERVAPGGPAERAALEEARLIVSNDVLPLDFAKGPGARYLQTWHGTPLKRIGYDVVNPTFPDSDYHYAVELGRDVARWDVLLAANEYSAEVLRRAFRFDGEIAVTGYPRNDVLLDPGNDRVRARVRAQLGLGEDTRAVLYAPTWRDSFTRTPQIEVDALRAGLGSDVVLLVRAHGLVTAALRLGDDPHVRDVTDWPDISDLYLAADVLLVDYSSAMFDFALTGKPILFLVHDLARYRDELRGFYFDFEAEAPGPVLRSPEEVVAALADLDAATAPFAEAYERFRERFAAREDGRSSERVLDLVLGDDAHGPAARTPSGTA